MVSPLKNCNIWLLPHFQHIPMAVEFVFHIKGARGGVEKALTEISGLFYFKSTNTLYPMECKLWKCIIIVMKINILTIMYLFIFEVTK